MAIRREMGSIPDGPLNDRMMQAANDIEKEEKIVLNLPEENPVSPVMPAEDLAKKYPKPSDVDKNGQYGLFPKHLDASSQN